MILILSGKTIAGTLYQFSYRTATRWEIEFQGQSAPRRAAKQLKKGWVGTACEWLRRRQRLLVALASGAQRPTITGWTYPPDIIAVALRGPFQAWTNSHSRTVFIAEMLVRIESAPFPADAGSHGDLRCQTKIRPFLALVRLVAVWIEEG